MLAARLRSGWLVAECLRQVRGRGRGLRRRRRGLEVVRGRWHLVVARLRDRLPDGAAAPAVVGLRRHRGLARGAESWVMPITHWTAGVAVLGPRRAALWSAPPPARDPGGAPSRWCREGRLQQRGGRAGAACG